MKDEQLKSVLARIDLNKCDEIIKNHIYYSKRPVRQRCYRGDGSFRYINDEYEFLIIAENGEKQAIILRCGFSLVCIKKMEKQAHIERRTPHGSNSGDMAREHKNNLLL